MIAWGLVAFNRPAHTRRVIQSLRANYVQPLYVFVDGPQDASDLVGIQGVLGAIEEIDWTRPTVIVRTGNLGLRRSVLGAVDEMFLDHDMVVMIEDDCVLGPQFSNYMVSCLKKYRFCDQVMSISGYTVPIGSYPWDVYFHPRIGSWGWGTWKRAWRHYQWDLQAGFSQAASRGIDLREVGMDVPGLVQAQIHGRLDAWTPGWLLGVALREGLCVYPRVSHVSNIGFDGSGVHCGRTKRWESPMASRPIRSFPPEISIDQEVRIRVNSFYGGTLYFA